MPRDHFAQYRNAKPQEYKAFSDSMWNGFVSITKHVPIMGRFFSFTPELLQEIDLDKAEDLGAAYGEVYSLAEGMIDYTITNDEE